MTNKTMNGLLEAEEALRKALTGLNPDSIDYKRIGDCLNTIGGIIRAWKVVFRATVKD